MPDVTPAAGRARRLLHRAFPDSMRSRVTASYRPLLRRGDAVACPVCGRRFDRFLDHRGQPSVRCPACGSMERHRLLWLWLRAETDFFTAPHRVLHFAPEYGVQRRLRRQPNLRYWSVDLASQLADEHLDITDIPHDDRSWDVILCNHVLEHIPDDRQAMRELHRVLAPGGMAIVMTPTAKPATRVTLEDPAIISDEERLRRYGQEDHVRLYAAEDFVGRLIDTGFDVESHDYLSRLPSSAVELHRLAREHPIFDDDIIYVARRPGPAASSTRP